MKQLKPRKIGHDARTLMAVFAAICWWSGSSAAASDFQSWNSVAITGAPVNDSRLLFWFDGHARFRNDADDLGVTIIRPALGWRVNKKLSLWAGYARVTGRTPGLPDVEENRIWQQATYPVAQVLGGSLSGRTRLEQRFRVTGDDTGWRVRQAMRWERRFDDSPFSLVLSDELFVNFNDADWGQASGFDQNRLFVGSAWRLNKNVRFEGGYMHNRVNPPNRGGQTNHNLSLTLFLGL